MTNDHYEREAADLIKDARKIEPRVLLFALLLLMSHILELQPSTVDAGGVKLSVKDVVVIRGGVALIFLYYFCSMITLWMDGFMFLPLRTPKHFVRNLIRNEKRKKEKGKPLAPAKIKKSVRSMLNTRTLVGAPFFVVRFYLVAIALAVSVPNVWLFGGYVFEQLHNR